MSKSQTISELTMFDVDQRTGCVICGLVLFVLGICAHLEAADRRPNVVLIISDDQYAGDFGFMGNQQVQTPHLDRLAENSARFVNGSVPTSVCSPSLATLLTGLYPHEHGIHYNHPPPGNSAFNKMQSLSEYRNVRSRGFDLIRQVETLPEVLGREGAYLSLQTGKFWEGHFRNARFTHGMTRFEPVPGQDFGGNRTLANGELAAHGNGDWGLQIGRVTMEPIRQFLDHRGDKPFLIWYAPFLPHQPHDSPQCFYDLYRNAEVREQDLPYYASITQFDDTVGELVQMIADRGLTDETLFVFVIDNGWQASSRRERSRTEEFAHTKNSKRSPFEPGLRTPILFSWRGVIEPRTFPEPVSSIDIVPSVYSACEIDSGRQLPGLDLWQVMSDQVKLNANRCLFGEIYPGDATQLRHPEEDIAYRWCRQNQWKLIVPHTHGDGPAWNDFVDRVSLFNLEEDPHETKNLADEPQFASIRQSLEHQLDMWWDGKKTKKYPMSTR